MKTIGEVIAGTGYKAEAREIDALRTRRLLRVQHMRQAQRCKELFPTSGLRIVDGVFEIFEPATGFVRGRGRRLRSACREAIRRAR